MGKEGVSVCAQAFTQIQITNYGFVQNNYVNLFTILLLPPVSLNILPPI